VKDSVMLKHAQCVPLLLCEACAPWVAASVSQIIPDPLLGVGAEK